MPIARARMGGKRQRPGAGTRLAGLADSAVIFLESAARAGHRKQPAVSAAAWGSFVGGGRFSDYARPEQCHQRKLTEAEDCARRSLQFPIDAARFEPLLILRKV